MSSNQTPVSRWKSSQNRLYVIIKNQKKKKRRRTTTFCQYAGPNCPSWQNWSVCYSSEVLKNNHLKLLKGSLNGRFLHVGYDIGVLRGNFNNLQPVLGF